MTEALIFFQSSDYSQDHSHKEVTLQRREFLPHAGEPEGVCVIGDINLE